ncbi:TPA: hypothetical protein ACXDAZ_002505 [Clostridium botulinum]
MIKINKDKLLKIFYDEDSDFIHINSKEDDFNILYGNGMNMHGLQCKFQGDTKEYNQILKLLDDISDKVEELYKICK